jgi:hypothetical protein
MRARRLHQMPTNRGARANRHHVVIVGGGFAGLFPARGLKSAPASVSRRRLGRESRPFRYRNLGILAAVSRFSAVARLGLLEVGGFAGWLVWLFVHLTFPTGFKNRAGALARFAVTFVGRGRYERALNGPLAVVGGGAFATNIFEGERRSTLQSMFHDPSATAVRVVVASFGHWTEA